MKLRRSFALMALLAAMGGTVTVAQETKKGADDKKKAPAAKVEGKIEVYQGKSGWRWRVKNADDKTIAMPTKGHEKKEDALKEIDDLKTILGTAKPVDVKE